MENMVTEWWSQFMDLLPITDVFVCRSVSREWKAAADHNSRYTASASLTGTRTEGFFSAKAKRTQ